jgi:hypothetical protein
MKRLISLLTVVGILMLFTVSAAAAEPRRGAVTELYSAEGIYTDSVGNTESYTFHVPLIAADTEQAEAINSEIRDRFGKLVEQQFSNMEGGFSLWSWNAEWHAYWHENQLFLLIKADMEGGFTDYAAYGYDFSSGERVSNEMILRELGISEEEYLSNLKEKVQFMFEDMYKSISEENRELLGYDALLEKTLSWVNMEQPMLIAGSGNIETIVKIASIAGAEWYYHLATPFSYG